MDHVKWPTEVEVHNAEESYSEKKDFKDVFKAAIKKDDKHKHQILTEFNLKKYLHALASVSQCVILRILKRGSKD